MVCVGFYGIFSIAPRISKWTARCGTYNFYLCDAGTQSHLRIFMSRERDGKCASSVDPIASRLAIYSAIMNRHGLLIFIGFLYNKLTIKMCNHSKCSELASRNARLRVFCIARRPLHLYILCVRFSVSSRKTSILSNNGTHKHTRTHARIHSHSFGAFAALAADTAPLYLYFRSICTVTEGFTSISTHCILVAVVVAALYQTLPDFNVIWCFYACLFFSFRLYRRVVPPQISYSN